MAGQDIQSVITGRVRFSYMHVLAPYASKPGDTPKYSATLLVPKSDFATKQNMDAAINAAIAVGTASKWGGVRPPIIAPIIHDGDGVRPTDGMPFGEECKGHWVVTATSYNKAPQIVDATVQPIMTPSEIYSGIYGRASVRFYPYFSNNKRGISCGLNNIQKLEDGPSLGGGTTAAADFGDPQGAPAWNAAPAYPQAAPAAPVYPQAPTYPPQQQNVDPITGRPIYPQAAPVYPAAAPTYSTAAPSYQAAPAYPQAPSYPQAIDPITGRPVIGQVMGL